MCVVSTLGPSTSAQRLRRATLPCIEIQTRTFSCAPVQKDVAPSDFRLAPSIPQGYKEHLTWAIWTKAIPIAQDVSRSQLVALRHVLPGLVLQTALSTTLIAL